MRCHRQRYATLCNAVQRCEHGCLGSGFGVRLASRPVTGWHPVPVAVSEGWQWEEVGHDKAAPQDVFDNHDGAARCVRGQGLTLVATIAHSGTTLVIVVDIVTPQCEVLLKSGHVLSGHESRRE